MTENTQPAALPTGVDIITFTCPECGLVMEVVTGLSYGSAPLDISAPANRPCGACRAKGH